MARGIYNRPKADRFYTGSQILTEAQWRLNTMVSASGYSAYQLVFGSNPMDLYGWGDTDEDLLFARDTSISGQFVQQWQLRIRAQEAALKEIANSKLRRLLAYNKTFDCADIKVGGSVLFYKAPRKKSNPRWRGPAAILDIDESGVVLKFQPQSFKVARYCVRRKLEEKDLPGGTAMGDNQLNFDWEMSQPLVLPTAQGDSPDSEMAPDESSRETSVSKERDTQSTASPKLAPAEDSTDVSELIPRPDDPVPMSLDSDGPVQESSPSDESWTELYDRTCGNNEADNGSGGASEALAAPGFSSGKTLKTKCPPVALC